MAAASDLTASIDISVLQERLTNMINLVNSDIRYCLNIQVKSKVFRQQMTTAAMSGIEIAQKSATIMKRSDLEFAICECCGLSEECTEAYVARVRERYQGWWICGLCAEAVKDEIARSEKRIGNEEALNQHMSFCKKFRTLRPPKNPTEELISAVKQLLLRSLDSPRSSPVRKAGLVRSESCCSAMDD
ncbi:uncharacterized protein Fot_10090 [Forsythia ovata]|uniref:Uncharacterized protein n=2 Tax=Forsythia ovata TaxID=205694 RepID=A0ABD1WGJ2_9LAMI